MFWNGFWELVAKQTNLKSTHDTLHSLKITDPEILHLTRWKDIICSWLKSAAAENSGFL
jgi:hypothetical protein